MLCISSGGAKYRVLPLHSQIPREDQHKVFEPVPDGVTKVSLTNVPYATLKLSCLWKLTAAAGAKGAFSPNMGRHRSYVN